MRLIMNFTLLISGNVLHIEPSGQLTTNREYLVTIDPYVSGLIPPDGGTIDVLHSTYQFWFTSIYCPVFTTLGRVKLLIGPAADTLLDDAIYRMIHKNSLDAVELYNLSNSTCYAYDYWGCDWQTVPQIIKRYVECKTAYDILALLKQMGSSTDSSSNQLKTLGDMTIKYGGGGASSNNPALTAPDKMKAMYDCWNEMLRAFNHINTAIRGYHDTSKGFAHPVREPQHNRVIRPVVRNGGVNEPSGPWEKGYYWRGFNT